MRLGRALVIVLLATWALPAQLFPPERTERIQLGVRDVYNLEYETARQRFQELVEAAPDDPAGYVYLAWTEWVKELGSQQELSIDRFASSDFFSEAPLYRMHVDPGAEARFRQLSQQGIDRARARLSRNPNDRTALFVLGQAYQNLASFEASLKRSWWSAFRYGSRTYRYNRDLLRQDPNLYDARLATGVYHYVTGSLAWNVKWLAFAMGYSGGREAGKREIETTAERGQLAGDDARVVLTLIYTREHRYPQAFEQLQHLLRKYPQNYLVHLDMGGLALLMKRPEAAVEIYQDVLRKIENGERKYAQLERASVYNRLGVAGRAQGDLAASAGWLNKSVAEAPAGARSHTIARLELGKTLDLQGRRREAQEQYRIAAAAEDIAGSRQEATELLRKPYRR
jgi:tetratricopeptide (TPR) repeat protein